MLRLLLLFVFTKVTVAQLVTVTKCGSVISRDQFVLQSIGYPAGYPTHISCEFVIKGHDFCQTQFQFQFLDFDLAMSSNCSGDKLVINDEEVCEAYAGEVKMYKSLQDQLHVKFLSGDHPGGRGFRILVTRLFCNETIMFRTRERQENNLTNCCASSYSARRFYLASPGFPFSNQPADCVYSIKRSNPNICRLRIHFQFFWLGAGNCQEQFFEIDSKRICGCRSDLDVISKFDQYWGDSPKLIRYVNLGQPKTHFNGFVAEIIQDECPTRYSPSLESNRTISNNNRTQKTPEFYFYNDQLNRISWPNVNRTQNLVSYYFYEAPSYQEREQREYFETMSDDLPPNYNDYKCRIWSWRDWYELTQHILWKKMPQCRVTQQLTPQCCVVNHLRGYLTSPGYPFYYPNNLNCCYKFQKRPGYCSFRLSVLDFNLEMSENCNKDSLIIYNTYKYCGNSLLNTQFVFDLNNKEFEDVQFLTDQFYYGRGFNIVFQQLPCMNPNPISPPMDTCGGEITSEHFVLNIPKSSIHCVYNIRKFEMDVCGVELLLVNFDLLCGAENLSINNKQYCGQLTGRRIFSQFDLYDLVNVVYRKSQTPPVLSSIVARGQQIRGNCDQFVLDVPAQRRLTLDIKNHTIRNQTTEM